VDDMTGLKRIFLNYKTPIFPSLKIPQFRNKIQQLQKQTKFLCERMKKRFIQGDTNQLRQSILDIAVEEYRMREALLSILYSTYPTDISRFENRYRYFSKEVEKALNNSGFRIIGAEDFVGKSFDIGMAVKPLNMKSFNANDELVIEQMIEPVIMDGEIVARVGLVRVRRK